QSDALEGDNADGASHSAPDASVAAPVIDGSSTDEPVDTPTGTIAPGVVEFGTQSAIGAGIDTGTDDTEGDTGTPAAPVTAAPEAPASSGSNVSISTESLTVIASGPRFDVSGRANITADGRSYEGQLSGRLNAAADTDSQGRQRFDGTLTLVTDEGTVSVVLAGYATANADSFTLAGRYRVSGAAVGLEGSGSFSGSFGESLRLSLVA
ncbi:MAG: hypothetical protein ACKOD2_01700, partial [Ilumatobacteraceae bacterium]